MVSISEHQAVSTAEHLPGTLFHLRSPQQASPSASPPPPPPGLPGSLGHSVFPDLGSGPTSLQRPGWSTVAKSRRGLEEPDKKKQTF